VKIATIICYCTNDFRFLKLCVDAAKPFSSQVLIPVCDHFYNGKPEERKLLNYSYEQHPDCTFIEFAYDHRKPYGLYCPYSPLDEEWPHFWHSTSRYVGCHFLDSEITHLLFLDVDEIVDTERFLGWLKNFDLDSYSAVRLSSYLYFRKPSFRAKSFIPNALLVKREALTSLEMILNIFERKGIFDQITGTKLNHVTHEEIPLVHHYSWVREPVELIHKVQSWGHARERDWPTLLTHELKEGFRGKDTFFGLTYEEVEPVHDPFSLSMEEVKKEAASLTNTSFPHVTKVTSDDLRRRMILS
jgi:hypothetical protein